MDWEVGRAKDLSAPL